MRWDLKLVDSKSCAHMHVQTRFVRRPPSKTNLDQACVGISSLLANRAVAEVATELTGLDNEAWVLAVLYLAVLKRTVSIVARAAGLTLVVIVDRCLSRKHPVSPLLREVSIVALEK